MSGLAKISNLACGHRSHRAGGDELFEGVVQSIEDNGENEVDYRRRTLVGAEIGKLGCPGRRWWAGPSRVKIQPARIESFQLAASSSDHEQFDI
jgi:hypothetical protein